MADNTFELPPTPPTTPSGPAIDPSSTAVPAAPRPTAPAPPSTTSSPWHPHFELPSPAPAGPAAGRAPAGARRAAVTNRTRVIVGGASVASFLAILAAVGLHGGSQPASNVNTTTTTNGDSLQTDPSGSTDNPFSRRFSGGFSATPGSGSGSPNTRSHGS